MSNARFQMVYDGPALANHEMDARDLSSALMAMDVVFKEADSMLNAGKTETRLLVKGSFTTGSFQIDFASAQAFADRFRDMLSGETTTAIINAAGILGMVKGLMALIKWLRNRKITKFEFNEGRVRVFVGEEYIEVEKKALDLFRNHKLKESLQKAIEEPLKKDGIDSFALMEENGVSFSVLKEEAPYFAVPKLEETELEDRRFETHLNIVSPSFQAGDKWRVNDGGSNFFVSISDQSFIESLLRDEIVLSASTTLKVLVHEVKFTDSRGILRKESDIEKVLEIIRPHEQLGFPADSSE